jgi:phosphinothricin acetyltransferase
MIPSRIRQQWYGTLVIAQRTRPRNPTETFSHYPSPVPHEQIGIRPATEADLPAINRIYNHEILHGDATWDTEPWSLERRVAWWRGHSDPLQPVLVAEVPPEVVGFAYLTLVSQKPGWRFTREDTIYLDPAARGRRIGHHLLAALLEEARRIGVRLVLASITCTNTTSIRLHESFGFERVGTLRNAGYKFGGWLDTCYYQLDLGEPEAAAPTWRAT